MVIRSIAVGGDHVALLDGEVAGAAVDGRADLGVAELHAGVFDRGLAGADIRLGAFDGGLVRRHRLGDCVGVGAQLLGLILGDDAALEQLGIAVGLRFGVFGLSGVARQIGLGLPERRLIVGTFAIA